MGATTAVDQAKADLPPVVRIVGVAGLLLAVWGVMFSVARAFPFVRPGADLVYAAKQDAIDRGQIFPSTAPGVRRVIIFGNSKVLAGFDPALFDRLSGGSLVSYNMGLPAAQHFLHELERLCARDQAPTDVLLTVPWAASAPPSLTENLLDEKWLRERLFPFHSFPRDATLFLLRARERGGAAAFYAQTRGDVQAVLESRGYYFIEGQSHFKDHRLPPEFVAASDTPEETPRRRDAIGTSGPEFEALRALVATHHLRLFFVPSYFREHEFADPGGPDEELARRLASFAEVRGPEYLRLPNELFSDPVHLNPEGARRYTEHLASLLASDLRAPTAGGR